MHDFPLHLFFRVVNVASRVAMLESIRNNEIRQHLISSKATIETISDILSDFIKWVLLKNIVFVLLNPIVFWIVKQKKIPIKIMVIQILPMEWVKLHWLLQHSFNNDTSIKIIRHAILLLMLVVLDTSKLICHRTKEQEQLNKELIHRCIWLHYHQIFDDHVENSLLNEKFSNGKLNQMKKKERNRNQSVNISSPMWIWFYFGALSILAICR